MITLKNGVLTDSEGRIGDIVANDQFQFDPAPGQPDAKYTSGFCLTSQGYLSVGGDDTFYKCLSGTFYNLYDENVAAQCSPVYIEAINRSVGSSASGSPAKQQPDGQVTGTAVQQMPDGQITGVAVTQITDGQVQAPTGAPVTQITDGQVQAPTGKPVTQITDGQIQAPTGAPVTQITDGQVQAPTGSPVTQITDGQVQAPTGSPVTQITDGQVQAPTGAPVSQISDGQIQAPTNGTAPTSSPSATYSAPPQYTGAATQLTTGFFAIAGVVAVAML